MRPVKLTNTVRVTLTVLMYTFTQYAKALFDAGSEHPEITFTSNPEFLQRVIISDASGKQHELDNYETAVGFLNDEIEKEKLITRKIRVGEHTGVVSPQGIKVGCHKVTFEEFDAIAEAVKKARNS